MPTLPQTLTTPETPTQGDGGDGASAHKSTLTSVRKDMFEGTRELEKWEDGGSLILVRCAAAHLLLSNPVGMGNGI